jgi:hypothetical protein
MVSSVYNSLRNLGFDCDVRTRHGFEVVFVRLASPQEPVRCVVPVPISASTPAEAQEQSSRLESLLNELRGEAVLPIAMTEDRWNRDASIIRVRLLAHLGDFESLYARKGVVRKIDKETAARFLEYTHSYGDAACKYRYGLFLSVPNKFGFPPVEGLVAVATFSNARTWQKGDKVIRSYEWVRYASLPEYRVCGGMGKLLKAFIDDVHPDDIMSYADLEWSEGKVYEKLGFVLEGKKEPVMFQMYDRWRRVPYRPGMPDEPGEKIAWGMDGERFFQNLGSNKYRLKLTEYE